MKTYHGNCHCGAFKFEINVPELKTARACDCSLCFKKGYLFVTPEDSQFKVIKGADSLVDYPSKNGGQTHKFCRTCGSGVLVEDHIPESIGSSTIQVNARMLMDVNPFLLEILSGVQKKCSGDAPSLPFSGELPNPNSVIENAKVYTGGCHCGAVSVAIKTKPLPEVELREDNCSICQRNANLCVYPHQSQVTIVSEENCTEYVFGRKFTGHRFCKICGVPVYMKIHGPPKAIFDSWPEARRNAVKGNFEILPLRIHLLNDVEWSRLHVERSDEGTEGYAVE